MKKEKSSAMGTPYTFEGRIPLKQAIPLGLQHVMAMFIGNLTPLLIIMGACGLTADAGYGALRTALLQNAMNERLRFHTEPVPWHGRSDCNAGTEALYKSEGNLKHGFNSDRYFSRLRGSYYYDHGSAAYRNGSS